MLMFRRPLLLAALAAWAVGSRAVAAPEVPLLRLDAQTVGAGITLEGSLQARQQSTVSAQAGGRVLQLLVKAGDAVKKGQVLALIDDRAARAEVDQTQAGIAQAQAQWRNAQLRYERSAALVNQGFMGKATLDDARAALETAQAARDQAQAAHRQSTLAHGFTRVTAAQSGLVLNTQVQAGDLAGVGAPIATLYVPGALRAVVYVPASLMDQVRQAASVAVRLRDGQWLQPSARTVLPAADPVSQTVELRLDLNAQQTGNAVPGEQLQVRFGLGQAQRLVVPRQALVRRGELTAVYIAQGEGESRRYVLRALRLGQAVGADGVEVLAGVRAGEQLALQPLAAAQHGGARKD